MDGHDTLEQIRKEIAREGSYNFEPTPGEITPRDSTEYRNAILMQITEITYAPSQIPEIPARNPMPDTRRQQLVDKIFS